MASTIMNAIKEEVAVSATTATSVSSTIASASRSTVSHSIAASAPSASVRVATSHAEETGLLACITRSEAIRPVQIQSILGNPSVATVENPTLSSVFGRFPNSESNALKNALPELREQISQAVQQGFEELVGDQVPQLEPTLGIAETIQQLEEIIATR